jgi:hypothetical protein
MRPHNRTINSEVWGHVTALAVQTFPELPPDTSGSPASDAVVHRLPMAELRRHIAPWPARAGHVQDRLDEQAVLGLGGLPAWY